MSNESPRMPKIPKNARFRAETEREDATIRGPIGNQSCYAKSDSGSGPRWESKRNVRLDDGQVTWLFEHLFAHSARIDEGEIDTMRAFVGILDALEAAAVETGQLQDNIRFVIAQLRGRIEAESDGTELVVKEEG